MRLQLLSSSLLLLALSTSITARPVEYGPDGKHLPEAGASEIQQTNTLPIPIQGANTGTMSGTASHHGTHPPRITDPNPPSEPSDTGSVESFVWPPCDRAPTNPTDVQLQVTSPSTSSQRSSDEDVPRQDTNFITAPGAWRGRPHKPKQADDVEPVLIPGDTESQYKTIRREKDENKDFMNFVNQEGAFASGKRPRDPQYIIPRGTKSYCKSLYDGDVDSSNDFPD